MKTKDLPNEIRYNNLMNKRFKDQFSILDNYTDKIVIGLRYFSGIKTDLSYPLMNADQIECNLNYN
jgi:hypothetical protein